MLSHLVFWEHIVLKMRSFLHEITLEPSLLQVVIKVAASQVPASESLSESHAVERKSEAERRIGKKRNFM